MTDETCWTLIQAVRGGDTGAKDLFVGRYLAPVRAYLAARWKSGPLAADREDAAQEVFMRCFSESGPLSRVNDVETTGFRAYLYGVCRNVAREFEARRDRDQQESDHSLEELAARETRLSTAFDRAFARQVMKEARDEFHRRSTEGDETAQRRFELLALRFEQNLPIRDIATRWNQDPARVHKEYARARREYRQSLYDIVARQNPGMTTAQVEAAAKRLLELIA